MIKGRLKIMNNDICINTISNCQVLGEIGYLTAEFRIKKLSD